MPQDLKNRGEFISEFMDQANKGVKAFEPPLERLTRLHKEDPKRARVLAAKIRQALPKLSTKPLSAQDKIRARSK